MWHYLFWEAEISKWHMEASPTCFIRQVSSVKTTSEETLQKYALHTAHIFTCTGTRPSHSSPQVCQSVSKMLCRAAAGVDAHVTRDVSHSIPAAGTGDSPRGQKWAKDRNSTPIQISCATASTASVIHSSCDTAAMCRGGLFTQWDSGTWILKDLAGICHDQDFETNLDFFFFFKYASLKTYGKRRWSKICTFRLVKKTFFCFSSKNRTTGILKDSLPFREFASNYEGHFASGYAGIIYAYEAAVLNWCSFRTFLQLIKPWFK